MEAKTESELLERLKDLGLSFRIQETINMRLILINVDGIETTIAFHKGTGQRLDLY
ncbi:hypothetical protein JMN32_05020 [Fulvivirga sp. 29W222]|uniref:Uncharacterized protein n=1 Tax=Fulvivirga marina TaxID=2494733 RepID=A0A937FW99_9BACT|nr:hypothetical protein [Fulvivirga marina]MBL6445658.1 hypothetical protein [Fulvivirga marina]